MLARVTSSRASTVDAYLSELPEDRRSALAHVRSVIRKHLPRGFAETMQYGMISYVIPLSDYPDTYNGQALTVAALASQKNYMAVYLMGLYSSPELRTWFEAEYAKSGKRLDAGKSCVRFKRLDDLALDAVAVAIEHVSVADLIAQSVAAHGGGRGGRGGGENGPSKAPSKAQAAQQPAKKAAKSKPKTQTTTSAKLRRAKS
jgi:hypothetical protein